MNELQVFENPDFGQVRTVTKDGEPWFVAADVCRALGLEQVTNTIRRLDDDEKALISIKGISKGNDQVSIVNEPGLYSLVLGSRKPEAKNFKRWITHEVIPSIRKTGSYSIQEPETPAQLRAKAMMINAKTRLFNAAMKGTAGGARPACRAAGVPGYGGTDRAQHGRGGGAQRQNGGGERGTLGRGGGAAVFCRCERI